MDSMTESRKAASRVATPVERVRALQPLIAEHADRAEREGCMAPEVREALAAAGLFRITVARRVGGEGATMRDFVDTVSEIGKTCPGTAWAYGLVTGATGMAQSLPERQRQLLLKNGDGTACFVGVKGGVASPVEGGYLVTGSWAYGSGCRQANWACCGVTLRDQAGNDVGTGSAFIDLSDSKSEIVLDWKVSGLSGSGSNTIRADGHFVPTDLLILDADFIEMRKFFKPAELEPRDLWPVEPQFGLTVLPPMLGAAEGLLQAVRSKMNDRTVLGWQYEKQSDSEVLVAKLGEAAMKIRSARMHIYRSCDLVDEVSPVRTITQFEKVQSQADVGYAMLLLRQAAEGLMDIAGPGAFALANKMQRYWRDLAIGSRHNSLNSALSLELLGRAMVGRKSNIMNIPQLED